VQLFRLPIGPVGSMEFSLFVQDMYASMAFEVNLLGQNCQLSCYRGYTPLTIRPTCGIMDLSSRYVTVLQMQIESGWLPIGAVERMDSLRITCYMPKILGQISHDSPLAVCWPLWQYELRLGRGGLSAYYSNPLPALEFAKAHADARTEDVFRSIDKTRAGADLWASRRSYERPFTVGKMAWSALSAT
jgi:hypothetical protein